MKESTMARINREHDDGNKPAPHGFSVKRLVMRLFCSHEMAFVRNIYGDEIMEWAWNRSIWRCVKCGKVKALPYLHDA